MNASSDMDVPVVSVLIPTHDRPALLREAISSVLANGYERFEVVVSDNSQDGTARDVVAGFADSRLRYLRGPVGQGPFANWQNASTRASGTYCFKLDDDDRILPGFLSSAVGFLNEHPEVASVYPGFAIADERFGTITEVIDTDFFRDRPIVSGAEYVLGVLLNEGGYPRNHKNTPFYRRSAGEAIGFYQDAPEDFAFSVALATRGSVGYLPAVFYHWRIHGQPSTYDFLKIWRGSVLALEKVAASRTIGPPPSLESRWADVLRRSRCSLHLFYLHAALREQGRLAAWRLWRQMRQEPTDAIPGIRCVILLAPGFVLSSGLNRLLISLYQRNRVVQSLVRSLVRA
jgi:glycosyltransferase involved in cell wall biosynthesis